MSKATAPYFLGIFVLLGALLLVACVKEYSYEGGPNAMYTLIGSPGACEQQILKGNYYAGVKTDTSNSVQVSVNVTLAGKYNIYTDAVDGITFSASGNFADTGKYIVTLNCSGTPDSIGSFSVKIPGNNGCYFILLVKEQAPSSYTLSGYPNDCESPNIEGSYIAGQNFKGSNTVTVNVNVISPGNYTIQTDTIDGMNFSASGYFSTTGNQSVTLTGTGTPNSPGLVFFRVTADSSQCSFSIPVQNADPLAVYVLESAIAQYLQCTPHVVQGSYISGTSLINTNTVTIGVYVATVGNYTISTGKINGMVFSYSATFTNTGEQNVVLYGTGTPSSTGDFIFTPQIIGPSPLGGNSCGFDINVQ